VIDDEVAIGKLLRRALQEHDVTSLDNAREAFALLGQGQRFDVVLCDLMMPVMSGPELHAAVNNLDPQQADRMVFMTGGAFAKSASDFLLRVANHRIQKPFGLEELRSLVNSLV
jgi:DNA-binding NtrC family response regulator